MSFNEQKKLWFTFIFIRFVEGIWLQLPELQSSAISICSCNSSSLTNSSPFIRWKVLFWSPLNLMAPPTILGFWNNKRKYVIPFCWFMGSSSHKKCICPVSIQATVSTFKLLVAYSQKFVRILQDFYNWTKMEELIESMIYVFWY